MFVEDWEILQEGLTWKFLQMYKFLELLMKFLLIFLLENEKDVSI